jgi:hypothetical protein
MNAGHTLSGMGIAVLEAFNVGGHLDDARCAPDSGRK